MRGVNNDVPFEDISIGLCALWECHWGGSACCFVILKEDGVEPLGGGVEESDTTRRLIESLKVIWYYLEICWGGIWMAELANGKIPCFIAQIG